MDAREHLHKDEKQANEWIKFGMRLAISTAFHPLDYTKTLVQLGYEPIPGRPGRSFLGRPVVVFPNFIQYVRYIRRVDGFGGCFRGLTPKIAGSILSMTFSEKIVDKLNLHPWDSVEEPETNAELYVQYKVNLKRDIALAASGVIISHPFHVISVRMMAQFIGRETVYTSIFGSISEIYETSGLSGFFSGLGPRLLGEVSCVFITSTAVYMFNKYCFKDKYARQYNSGLVQFIVASVLYPLQVVSTCMCVSGSRLMAGQPPIMPDYKKWTDCWNDLSARGELKRGSSMFWRTVAVQPKRRTIDNLLPMPKLAPYRQLSQ